MTENENAICEMARMEDGQCVSVGGAVAEVHRTIPSRELSKHQISLLLFLETCAVDQGGAVDSRKLNQNDLATLNQWKSDGYVLFGRIKSADFGSFSVARHWCRLSKCAFEDAHYHRRLRAQRSTHPVIASYSDVQTFEE